MSSHVYQGRYIVLPFLSVRPSVWMSHFCDHNSSYISRRIWTKLDPHCKPTDTHQYLLPSSCRPPHCMKNMAYDQALRVRRICYDLETVELTRYFLSRGHDTNHTLETVDSARNMERSEALISKSKGALFRVPFVTTYHPKLPPIGTILRKHWHFIESHSYLLSFPRTPRHCLPTPPQPA
jgi:hypothetical protein